MVRKEMASTGSGTVRRRGLAGVGVVLLEEVCSCGDGLGSLFLKFPSVWQSTSSCL